MDIITAARQFKKLKNKELFDAKLKVAVLGTISTQYFVMMLDYQLHNVGIEAEIYEGEYNGIAMDVFDSQSELYRFNPDIVILLTHYTDVKAFPQLLDSTQRINEKTDGVISYYRNVWKKLERITNVKILQSNYAIPPEHLLGNLETQVDYSKTNFFRKLNERLVYEAPKSVTIIDLELMSQYIGKYQWFDYKVFFTSKFGFKLDYLVDVVEVFRNQIMALNGQIRKCLVLDLDNTLWGGVIGDEGYDGIQLDPNNAIGEAYRYFQSYILDLKKKGVILAVCSKNDEINAKEPFEKNSNMILKLNDISCFVANWDDKVTNIKRIAAELNIGTDSMVFVDDNPAERDIVKRYLPEVHVIDLPSDPALYSLQLDKENPFNWLQYSDEDIKRSASYVENQSRVALELQFDDYDEYLKALDMHGKIGILTEKEVPRFTQLLNKSNQFNLRTRRYTEDEIFSLLNDGISKCLYIQLRDKFSDYGIISCVVLKKQASDCVVESWVMSCRVLKRGVENMAFAGIIDIAKQMGCEQIVGEYIKTKKNNMVSGFYDSLGFECVEKNDDIKRYIWPLDNKMMLNYYISEESE